MKKWQKIILSVLIISFIPFSIIAYDIGLIYGSLLINEHDKLSNKMENEFKNNQKIFCNNTIILKSNNWVFDKENKRFIKEDTFLDMGECIGFPSVTPTDAINLWFNKK